MSHVIEVTDATFESVVVKSSTPVLVDYWADWCAPCKRLSPVIDGLASDYRGRVAFAKVDTNVNRRVAVDQAVLSLPTIQMWRDGRLVGRLQGGQSRRALVRALDKWLG